MSEPLKGPLYLIGTVGGWSAEVHGPFASMDDLEQFLFEHGIGLVRGAKIPLDPRGAHLLTFDGNGKATTTYLHAEVIASKVWQKRKRLV